ncbi:uncharacterized protein BT62DRAFT_616082 [Guyanagaster necrorhizus]|uniref:Secreted protein n=1 Tax=Guyanagaster necrorhizus TaxID=856835 RepID=A0A9P7VZQ9_9AGAR|nr:uncharacterized protein BT62DRAFT_616082 [Guyanagaster necrorhizus MCA 3950]KAG7449934.1 hypothetical protein BT62DRAFT_616082 [Guyanagaster necrorhizus MCA 3950]
MLKILLLISSTIYGVLDLWAAASQRSQHYRTSFAMGRVYDVEVECELYHHMMNEASEIAHEKKNYLVCIATGELVTLNHRNDLSHILLYTNLRTGFQAFPALNGLSGHSQQCARNCSIGAAKRQY